MGGFIVIDRFTNATMAAGLLHFALRRADNIHWQAIDVNKEAHAALKGQRPCVVWFTGLSGPASRPSPTSWSESCTSRDATPTCSTATTCGTG